MSTIPARANSFQVFVLHLKPGLIRFLFSIFSTLLFATSSLAIADFAAAESIPQKCQYATLKFKTVGEKLPFSETEYRALIKNVDDVLCTMEKPKDLSIAIQKKGTDAHYTFAENEVVSVGAYEKYPSGQTAHPTFGKNILAHEYTHSVFTINMRAASPIWGKWSEAEQNLAKLYSRISVIEQKISETTDLSKQKALLEEANQIQVEINGLRELLKLDNYVFSKAINEFFADVVPVILTGNPRALYQALKTAKKDELCDSVVIRDFSQNYGPQLKANWNKCIQKQIASNERASLRYSSLGPLRSFTWGLVAGLSQNPANRPRLAQVIFSVLADDFQRNFQTQVDIRHFDFVSWNESLAGQIRSRLSESKP